MADMENRLWLDNSELLAAAELLESLADTQEHDGDPDGAGASRDSAAAFRRISEASKRGKREPPDPRCRVRFPHIYVKVRATCD